MGEGEKAYEPAIKERFDKDTFGGKCPHRGMPIIFQSLDLQRM
jgi:hypothetical protein